MSECYDTEDVFDMIEDNNDEFTMQEIIPGPGVAPGGYTGMVLKKKSDANYDTEWDYQGSGGILLTGQCETYNDLPADPEQGEAWAVGTEAPYECYAWFEEWVDLGEIFPSGVSPAVSFTEIEGGYTLTITDADHPNGQSVDILNGVEGPAGPGVPTGGTAGQFLKKSSSTNYDTEWASANAGDISYSDQTTYATGTAGKAIADLEEDVAADETAIGNLKADLGYVENGNTCATSGGIPQGKYVVWKGQLFISSAAIAEGAALASGTNLTAVSNGGLNDLKNTFVTSGSQTYVPTFPTGVSEFDNGCRYWVQGNIVMLKFSFKITNATAGTGIGAFQSNIPSTYRPKSSLTGICENGASTGYSKYTFDAGGKFTIYPQETGTTYAYGFVTYLI